ncbi:MAG: amidohydrolase family protein, partial [Planctomycetota bacterium]
ALYLAELRAREKAQADAQFLPTAARIRDKLSRLVRDLDQAGVTIVPASSAPLGGAFPGASMIDELEAWLVAGFSHPQVLHAATRGAAEVFELDDRGAIEVGKVADLVLLDTDPRQSLDGYRKPAGVVVRGRLLDRLLLDDLLETVRIQQQQVRERLAEPIEIEPPSVPEDGALLMSGQVETKSLGSRISSEAWTAFRTPDGALHVRGRLVAPAQGRVAGVQMEIEQIVVDGLLAAFALQAKSGEDLLQVEGVYNASRFRIRREFNGEPVDTRTMVARPGAINLSAIADSVTTAFVLGQRKSDGPMTVLTFGDFFEPVEQRWQVDTGVGAERILRTAQGLMTLRYGRDGRLIEWGRIAGQAVTVTRPISFSTWGGGGLPVAFEPGEVPDGVDPGSNAPEVEAPKMPGNIAPVGASATGSSGAAGDGPAAGSGDDGDSTDGDG